jgi:prophage regulatory protein
MHRLFFCLQQKSDHEKREIIMAESILRKPEVLNRTGLSYSTIQRLIKKNEFPKPIKLPGYNLQGWVSSDVDSWIAETISAGRAL